MPARDAFSPAAQRDIEKIRDYYFDDAGVQVARHVLGQINKAFRFLAVSPGAGHRREDLTDAGVRFWPVMPYLIAYDPVIQPIGIARVFYMLRVIWRLC